MQTRGLEAFGRKVTTTASHLMAPNADATAHHYKTAMAQVHKQLARPSVQHSVFALARRTPTEIVRSKLSTAEIQHRAVSFLSDDLLSNIPEDDNSYSLFQGFKASFPEMTDEGKKHRRRVSRGRKLLAERESTESPEPAASLSHVQKEKAAMMHEFELLGVRKSMASSEIREIDNKIANLAGMRKIIMERLAGLEQEEALLEHDSTFCVFFFFCPSHCCKNLKFFPNKLLTLCNFSHRCRRTPRSSPSPSRRSRGCRAKYAYQR